MLTFKMATESDFHKAWKVEDDARGMMLVIGRTQWTAEYPSKDMILSDITYRRAYVISDGDEVVAYGVVEVGGEPRYDKLIGQWLTNGRYVVVHRLAVSVNHRRQGVSRTFFNEVERLCVSLGICSVKIDTNHDNVEMLSLLPRLGYSYCGEVDYGERGMRMAFEKVV